MKSKELRTQLVQDCQTIEELKSVIETLEEVEGSHSTYDSAFLNDRIEDLKYFLLEEQVGFMGVPWNYLTRTHGIRAKAMELFYYELNNI